MFGSSMVLTVGAALDRAQVEGLPVRLNVGGEWITGRVINHDGHGVAVLENNGDMCVFRPEAISGVRVPRREQEARPAHASRAPITAHPVAS
jgi:hypothetical protein